MNKHHIDSIIKEVLNEFFDREMSNLYRNFSNEITKEPPKWLIHFSTHTNSIMKNGFIGNSIKDKIKNSDIAASHNWNYGEDISLSKKGCGFAYDCEDIIDSGTEQILTNRAVMFIAPSFKFFCGYDNEKQVIFDVRRAKNKVLIYKWLSPYNRYCYYGVGNINGHPIYEGTLENVIKWVMENYRQYYKYLGNTTPPDMRDITNRKKYINRKKNYPNSWGSTMIF